MYQFVVVVMALLVLVLPSGLEAFCSRRAAGACGTSWMGQHREKRCFRPSWRQPLKRLGAVARDDDEDDDDQEGESTSKNAFHNQTTTTTASSSSSSLLATVTRDPAGVLTLQQQAAALRAEVASIEQDLRESKEAKRQKELADIDRWIEECLYVQVEQRRNNNRHIRSSSSSSNDKDHGDDDSGDDASTTTCITATAATVELLNSVDKAAQVLRDKRYSHEQVSKMFERICDTSPAQSRSNCSPLLALLVDAAGKLDCVEREENPNKRWDGKVERDLRQRLFAMDWGIHLEPRQEGNDRFV